MKLVCASCQRPIPAEDINLDMAIAKCRGCDSVFSFLDTLAPASSSGTVAEPSLPVPVPKRFRVDEVGKELTISYRWFSPVSFFLIFFCIFWDGFLIVWYAIALGAIFGGKGEPMTWVMAVFPLIHVAVGIGLTYYTIATFFNRTVIRSAGGEVSVRHGPLPWYGNQRVPTSDVRQVYCTEKMRHHKHGHSISYNVNLLRRDQSKATLLSHLSELDEALFIEQKLRECLGLEDEHVAGAIRA